MPDFWQGKKILVYIALAHHTRFILPVTERLSKAGAKIIYVVGQAERSQEITAINLGLDYVHVFDYLTPEDQADIRANYLSLRETFTRNLNTSFLFSTLPVTVIDKTIYSTAKEYVGFRNLIQKEKPDLNFALHELNRWGKMFSFWSKKNSTPVLTFQEGLYYGLNYGYTGHAQYSTLNLVWGKRIKHKLIDFEAPADRIIEVGNTHLSGGIHHQEKHHIRKKKRKELNCSNAVITLILFSGEIPNPNDFIPLFKSVSKTGGNHLLIKFHPSAKHDQVQAWISAVPNQYNSIITPFFGDVNLYDLLSAADICALAQASTTGLEALFFGKPLIQLDVPMKTKLPYSFTELEVAIQMTPAQLGKALATGLDFNALMDQRKIREYLASELSGTKEAITKTIDISKQIVQASQSKPLTPISANTKIDKEWSIILSCAANSENLLRQLEAISVNSEESGEFEVILIEPPAPSKPVSAILDSLKGNLLRVKPAPGHTLAEMINQAAKLASGKNLVFMNKNLIPQTGWLVHLKTGIRQYGSDKIFGARIWDEENAICHAGLVIDKNNSPVSAFRHLPKAFPEAQKSQRFELMDQMLCMEQTFFFKRGGFHPRAGRYAFMDFCLRSSESGSPSCVYLPRVCLVSMENEAEAPLPEEVIFFYGKWQSRLWENQTVFHEQNKVTQVSLDTARLTHSMVATP